MLGKDKEELSLALGNDAEQQVHGAKARWRKCSTKRRLVRILGHAVLFTIVFTFVGKHFFGFDFDFGSGFGLLPTSRFGKPPPWIDAGDSKVDWCLSGYDWSHGTDRPPSDGAASIDERHTLSTGFELPLSADALYLLARGAASSGAISVTSSNEAGNKVWVQVNATYEEGSRAIDVAHVCLLSRGGDGEPRGLGIFTPNRSPWNPWPRRGGLSWSIDVVFPANAFVTRFATDMPNFSHFVADLQDSVHFGELELHTTNAAIISKSISADTAELQTTNGPMKGKAYNISDLLVLKSTNGPIIAESLFAKRAELSSSNGPIYGSFNASESLVVHSTNGPVVANITLLNDPSRSPTVAHLQTTNDVLSVNVSLLSTESAGGAFNVYAATTNGPLTLSLPEIPYNSTVKLSGMTTNSPASLALHPAYEGAFRAATSRYSRIVRVSADDAKDPSGEGRQRIVEWNSVDRGIVRGNAKWVPSDRDEKTLGEVEVTTTNSPITVQL